MADIRINALPTTATDFASDDYIAIDGTTNGTRKLNAKTANLTFSDVTLGTSGPSVKSTLSARAPRQGLVFDGTTGSSGTLGSIPSGTWTVSAVIDVPTSNPAANLMALTMGIGYGVAGGGSFVLGDINPSGNLTISQWAGTFPAYREATISGFRAAYSGKRVHLAAVVTGAALTVYINGVATSYTEASGAGAPAWGATLGSANVFVGKGQSALYYFSGGIYAPLIYNRALSASEVVSLYEAGAPAGADYNSASNTAVYSTDFSSSSGWTAESGWSFSGTAAVASGTSVGAIFRVVTALVPKARYRFTYTVTSYTSGSFNVWLQIGGTRVAGTNRTANGTYTEEIVAPSATGTSYVGVQAATAASCSFSVDDFSYYNTGLLLAPDAAQAGGGLVWYDTSGNAANITLPASGVSWNVPSSRVLGGNWQASGTLGVGPLSPLNQFDVSNSGTTNRLSLQVGTGDNGVHFISSGGTRYTIGSSIGLYVPGDYFAFNRYSGSSWSEMARFAPSGNFLLGAIIDSSNGKLQLATHTTSAGGIGFGTDASLYRYQAGGLALDATNNVPALMLRQSGTNALFAYTSSLIGYIGTPGAYSLNLQTNNTTALTLDSSQNATFAGTKMTMNSGASQSGRRQNLTSSITAGASTVSKKIAYVGASHSVKVSILAVQDNSVAHVATFSGDFTTSYGSNSTGGTTSAVVGNITAITVAYDNSGSPAYTINVTLTYTGNAPVIYYTIDGHSFNEIAAQ